MLSFALFAICGRCTRGDTYPRLSTSKQNVETHLPVLEGLRAPLSTLNQGLGKDVELNLRCTRPYRHSIAGWRQDRALLS